MPLAGYQAPEHPYALYFQCLEDLDKWAKAPDRNPLGVLQYYPRRYNKTGQGKLMVCHDYKGGYKEDPFSTCYTFNFWSSCSTFIYFSHHRVTIPPPGWVTASHRQGVKILGTLIFESGGETDCLRLLIGQLPKSKTGPARSSSSTSSLPVSPHYTRVLADLAYQRGFDGYLLNFECTLDGGIEQTQALTAWIILLQSELHNRVGPHAEVIWYDSVVFTGQLAWQDRLNAYNLPFFLASTGFFSNYTWPRNHPSLTAQYFTTIDQVVIQPSSDSRPSSKSLNDIYMGVDVWGRGSHGGGGFNSYRAIEHIAPESLGLSVALFGQAWTWETEQDQPGFSWDVWWEYERKLWVGPTSGEVHVPEAPRREGEPECLHGPFLPITKFFPVNPPPDPSVLAFCTFFCPGVGWSWFVEGVRVHQSEKGWTDLDKQTSLGNMLWPRPFLMWIDVDEQSVGALPKVLPSLCMEDAWNGGSSLRLSVSFPGTQAEDASFRQFWIPVQSLAVTSNKTYRSTAVYKMELDVHIIVDICLSIKSIDPSGQEHGIELTPDKLSPIELTRGWIKLAADFVLSGDDSVSDRLVAIGLIFTVATDDPVQSSQFSVLLGQLTTSVPCSTFTHRPQILWADYKPSTLNDASCVLTWEVASSFLSLTADVSIPPSDSPDPIWVVPSTPLWLPSFLYFNLYVEAVSSGNVFTGPENAAWIGTSGLDGKMNAFTVRKCNLPATAHASQQVRFYIQGIDDRGEVLGWEQCVYVDVAQL